MSTRDDDDPGGETSFRQRNTRRARRALRVPVDEVPRRGATGEHPAVGDTSTPEPARAKSSPPSAPPDPSEDGAASAPSAPAVPSGPTDPAEEQDGGGPSTHGDDGGGTRGSSQPPSDPATEADAGSDEPELSVAPATDLQDVEIDVDEDGEDDAEAPGGDAEPAGAATLPGAPIAVDAGADPQWDDAETDVYLPEAEPASTAEPSGPAGGSPEGDESDVAVPGAGPESAAESSSAAEPDAAPKGIADVGAAAAAEHVEGSPDVEAQDAGSAEAGEAEGSEQATGEAQHTEAAAGAAAPSDGSEPATEQGAAGRVPETGGRAEGLDLDDIEEAEEDALELQEVDAREEAPRAEPPPPPPDAASSASEAAGGPPPVPPEASEDAAQTPEAAAEDEGSAEPEAEGAAPGPEPQRRRRPPWFEEFFNDDYLRTVPEPTPKQVSRQCDFIERVLGLERGATILDVGCGLGLHAVELSSRGYLVVGLDLSLPMLSRAADEAQDRDQKINFLHADMREMTFEGAFDAVLCWGTTFGYFDDDTNRDVIARLYRALKPMGLLLLDVVNRDHVVPKQPNLVWFEGDGCVCMEETQVNFITSRLEVKRTVILDDGRQRESHYSIRLYSLHELGQLLHQQGFRVGQVSGMEATEGVFLGADSPRMIILAERRLTSPDQAGATQARGGQGGADGAPGRNAQPRGEHDLPPSSKDEDGSPEED